MRFTTGGGQCWRLDESGQIGTTHNLIAADTVATSGLAAADLDSKNADAPSAARELRCRGTYHTTGASRRPGLTPTRVQQTTEPVEEIAIGFTHRCACTADGRVYCKENNNHSESAADTYVH
jgi:hypothetical protein